MSQSPKISFCISSSGRESSLNHCLQSIYNQSFSSFEVLVATSCQEMNQNLKNCKVFLCENHVGKTRNTLKSQAKGEWLIFLDEDVELIGTDFVKYFLSLVAENSVNVFGGFYLSASDASLIDRAYNMTCNLWLLKSDLQGPQVLGGIYAIRSGDIPDYYDGYSFGGEEHPYFSLLLKNNFQIKVCKDWKVRHKPYHTLRSFFRRAWLHGLFKPTVNCEKLRWQLFFSYKENMRVKVLAGFYFFTVYSCHISHKVLRWKFSWPRWAGKPRTPAV